MGKILPTRTHTHTHSRAYGYGNPVPAGVGPRRVLWVSKPVMGLDYGPCNKQKMTYLGTNDTRHVVWALFALSFTFPAALPISIYPFGFVVDSSYWILEDGGRIRSR